MGMTQKDKKVFSHLIWDGTRKYGGAGRISHLSCSTNQWPVQKLGNGPQPVYTRRLLQWFNLIALLQRNKHIQMIVSRVELLRLQLKSLFVYKNMFLRAVKEDKRKIHWVKWSTHEEVIWKWEMRELHSVNSAYRHKIGTQLQDPTFKAAWNN